MKIGILADCFGLGFEEGIKKAAQMGVDGVQLYAVEGELAPENMSAEKREWAKNLVKENGLVISAICGDLGEGGFAFEDRNPGKILSFGKISFNAGSPVQSFEQELKAQDGLIRSVCTYENGVQIENHTYEHLGHYGLDDEALARQYYMQKAAVVSGRSVKKERAHS